MSHHEELLMSLYRTIRTIRRFEETGMEKYREGRIHGYFHTYIGEEAVAAGACSTLRADDYIVSTHRGHGHCIARGADIRLMMAELYGKAAGYSMGRGGSMHISDRVTGNIGANGIVGGGIPLAVGVGMGIRLEKSDKVVVCFFGDGASNNGVFGESLNLAAIYALPVVFVLENNCYAATTHVSETARCTFLSERAAGYGIPSEHIFGNDPIEVRRAVSAAVERARPGGGPSLVEAETYRMLGHHVRDHGTYMRPGDIEFWRTRDPLIIARSHLEEAAVPESDIAAADSEIEEEIHRAVAFAESSPEPDPDEFLHDVLAYYDPESED